MITIENEELVVQIAPQGAQMHSIRRKASTLEYLWQGDAKSWSRQAPVLFPFVGRLLDDQYTYQGHQYHQTQHGFARDMVFTVAQQGADWVVFNLRSDAQTKAVYPFDFSLSITYALDHDHLVISYQVENTDDQSLLRYALGAHPGFNIPLTKQGSFETATLAVNPAKVYPQIPLVGPYSDLKHPKELDARKAMQLNHQLFDHDALVFAPYGADLSLTLTEPQSGHGVEVKTSGTPFVGVWSQYPKTGNFICIEPWWGLADGVDSDGELIHKTAMNQLNPGASANYQFTIRPF
ncbi:MAG: aldose 1-epimerase family protein [Limosilactobacillus gorillae]|uniref:aldose 1-epimerase family protein n=1 Tax=Limosilactobacillus gorillae TaxID=1450649 RepID=UPI000A41148C|nr:aldose 1-epimerase family protein [Limosilactobacillus gorillae]MDO4855877.1 aldose 1-epimerase family protein [Limosilactobacillus gorillae]